MAYHDRVRVEWNQTKNRTNRVKHGLTFEEAEELFQGDVEYLVIYDDEHSESEDRFFAIGPIAGGIITVVYTEQVDDVVRILSARRATRREQALLRRHVGGTTR